jgi:hypothetical protein
MATIGRVSLEMGRAGDNQEFARVTSEVLFTEREIQENLNYTVQVELVEEDELIDIYIPVISFGESRFFAVPRENKDDRIKRFGPFTIRPDGRSSVAFERLEQFDVGDQESGNEEYRALVSVIPELSPDYRVSNLVKINLG